MFVYTLNVAGNGARNKPNLITQKYRKDNGKDYWH